MLLFAALLLLADLLNFGGVQAHAYIATAMVWLCAAACLIVWRILKRGRLDPVLAIGFLGGSVLAVMSDAKLAIWLIAACWAWQAAREDSRKVITYLKILVWVGVFEACLGFVQLLEAPGWIFGYKNAVSAVTGTFINRNHFAGVLEMLIPASIGLGFVAFMRRGSIAGMYLYILSAVFSGMALALSLSRAGLFSFLLSVVFLSILLLLRRSHRTVVLGLGFALLGLFFAGILWIGIDGIVNRYARILGPDAAVEYGRLMVFRGTTEMIRRFPQGVGIGKFESAFRPFQTASLGILFDHAHNDYLETTAEWGVAVAIPFWIVIIGLFVSHVRLLMTAKVVETQGILLACTGGCFAILVHSLADFNLQIPSNAIVFFTFVGIGTGLLFPKAIRRMAGGRR